jgi:hypothetical protein
MKMSVPMNEDSGIGTERMEVWRQIFRSLNKFTEAVNGNLSTSQIFCRSRTAMSEGPILRDV